MELKDVILSTLAEMEETPVVASPKFQVKETLPLDKPKDKVTQTTNSNNTTKSSPQSELMYLNSIKERLLVLFEGFQAPNNTNIEAKIDMTLNFLEYTLATIDARVELLEKGNRS